MDLSPVAELSPCLPVLQQIKGMEIDYELYLLAKKDWAGPSKKIRKSFLNPNVTGINNLDIIVDETISSKMTNPIADNDKYTETIKLDHTRLAKILIQTFDLNVKGLVSKYWSNLHKFLY